MEPKKKATSKVVKSCDCDKKFKVFEKRVEELEAIIEALNTTVTSLTEPKEVSKTPSINKLESWYEKEEPKQEQRLGMNYSDKIRSAKNAVKILPPNLVDSQGRHSMQNIGAICGFMVDEEMLEDIYKDY